MPMIPFSAFQAQRIQEFLDSLPDFDGMDAGQLRAYLEEVHDAIDTLDRCEPRNEASEEYDLWAEAHEDLEDVQDEILDCLDARNGV